MTMERNRTQPRRGFSMFVCGFSLLVIGVMLNVRLSSSSMRTTGSRCMTTAPKVEVSTTNPVDDRACQSVLDSLEARFDLQVDTRRKRFMELKNFDILEPEAICMTDERFGAIDRFDAFRDGPKFVCGVDRLAKKEDCLVYSVGSNNNIKFEKAVKKHMGCEIHTFDPTLQKPFVGDAFSTFHPWGIGTDGETIEFRNSTFVTMSIESIMNKLGHEGRKLDILKIDCEGCEYDALPPFFREVAKGNFQVDQVQVEMHHKGPRWKYKMIDFLDAVDKADLKVFHKERNGWGCYGVTCVEYALASRSFLRQANADLVCPKKPFELDAFGGKNEQATKNLRTSFLQEPVGYFGLDWEDLPTELKRAAKILTFTEEIWEHDETVSLAWDDLSEKQRLAATKLGFDDKSWAEENEDSGDSDE